MRLMITGSVLALLGVSALAAAGAGPLAALAGRYELPKRMGYVDGPADAVTDVVTIAPLDARRADVSLELFFFNGHSCDFSGQGTLQGRRLIVREPGLDSAGGKPCRLTLWQQGGNLRWSDGGGTCQNACGARGSLRSGAMPLTMRQP